MARSRRLLSWVCIACFNACRDAPVDSATAAPVTQPPVAGQAATGPAPQRAATAGSRASNSVSSAGVPAAGAPSPGAGSGAPPIVAIADAGMTPMTAGDGDAGTAQPAQPDAATLPAMPGMPGTVKVFDQIPQFGIYASEDPKGYTPPAGVLMWSHGTQFAVRLTSEQKARIGADLKARVTYHAQCDNYDRLGGAFFVVTEPAATPTEDAARTELVRFITPFSDYQRGALATHVFEDADVSSYAAVLADPAHDVWVGIGGGSNPYDGDPCTNTNMPDAFKAVGFKYSLELVSTEPLLPGKPVHVPVLYNVSATELPVTADLTLDTDVPAGHLTVIVSGHGAQSGGDEYMYTMDTLSVDGQEVGSFSTQVDCAPYAKSSPDGNQGIFRNNGGSNPRNWCPGALVPPRSFPVQLGQGQHKLSLSVDPARLPDGSYYATSLSFSAP